MLSIPGVPGSTCDGFSRREFIRVGGVGVFGLSLANVLAMQGRARAEQHAPKGKGASGWGKAKNVLFIFLQGGPSHLDIWDPKPEQPAEIRGEFKVIESKVKGVYLSETMPKLAKVMDKATLIRSLNYTPAGLFNHTAAIYQMMTGYTPDRVSPSGQLEPPASNDFPCAGSQIAKMKGQIGSMLPFVMLPRPLQESNVIGKGGTAGFLGAAYDPYYMFQDPANKINLSDFALRAEVSPERMQKRASLLQKVNGAMPDIEKAVKDAALDDYYQKALDLVISGKARDAFDLEQEKPELREQYGKNTFGQGLMMARRLIEAGTRFVQVNWPAVANGNPAVDAFDTHAANFGPLKNIHCPKLDAGLSTLLADMDARGLLEETLVVAVGEFGRSPRLGVSTSGNTNSKDGRDHWPYCYTGLVAGAGIKRGSVYGSSDPSGSSPKDNPTHPTQLLATMYHALGIDPATIVYNHLNQPRELVKAEAVPELFG